MKGYILKVDTENSRHLHDLPTFDKKNENCKVYLRMCCTNANFKAIGRSLINTKKCVVKTIH